MPSRKLEVEIIADASRFKRGVGEADDATGKLGKAFGGMGKVAALAGGAAGVAVVVGGLKSVVGAAKDAEVSQRGVETALKQAGTTYEAHKGQIDSVISSTSNLAALDDEDLADAFAKLTRTTGDVDTALKDTQLAADLARGAHISLEAATKAITGAELGRDTALKKLGISVTKVTTAQDAAKVQIEAYKAAHKDLSAAEEARLAQMAATAKATDKQATAQDALAEATKKYAGSAKAYGETAAGSQERLSVAFENLQESLGKKLLPILATVTEKLVDVIAWTEKNWPRFQAAFDVAADHVVDFYHTIQPILENVERVVEGVVEVVRGLIEGDWAEVWQGAKDIVIGAVKAAAEIDKLLGTLFLKAARALGEKVLEGLEAGLSGLAGIIGGLLSRAGSEIATSFMTSGPGKWAEVVASFPGRVADFGGALASRVGGFVSSAATSVASTIGAKVAEWAGAIAGLPGKVADFAGSLASKVGASLAGAGAAIATDVSGRVANWAKFITELPSRVASFAAELATRVVGFLGTAGATIAADVSARVGNWANFIEQLPGRVASFAGALISRVSGFLQEAGSAIAANVSERVGNWATFIEQFPSRVASFAGALAGRVGGFLAEAGADIAHNISDRIGNWASLFADLPGRIGRAVAGKADDLWNEVKSIFGKLPGFVKDLLGISSPSRVFEQIGHQIMEGAVKGIRAKGDDLRDAAMSEFKRLGGVVPGAISAAAGAVKGAVAGVLGADHTSNTSQPQNVALGQKLAAARGWVGAQWDALYNLFVGESGWNQYAYNASSGATGIPQALPYSKMPRAAWLPSQGGQADAAAQINWGLDYIAGRYGSPANAYAAWSARSPHWYGHGGVFTGPQIIGVGEKGPEAVIPLDRYPFATDTPSSAPVVINFNGPVYGDKRKVALEIYDELAEIDRQRTGSQILGGGAVIR